MINSVFSLAFHGVKVKKVEVQVHISSGLPAFTIVGLADKTVAEARERVKAALSSIGFALPAKKITINLAPANLIKEGSHFDLAIACALLAALDVIPQILISNYIVIGELSLDGSILPVAGALPAAMGAVEMNKSIICPHANGPEASWSGCDEIVAPRNLIALINHFKGEQILARPEADFISNETIYPDFADIHGQESAKRAIEIAASGNHNILMSGPPGAGKSMLASRVPGILPEMDPKEILECSTIASVAGILVDGKLTSKRPFRAPHHSCSMPAMIGGGAGRRVKPGEISLAHNGVLFLDELPEFPSSVLDSLRQPLETREVLISRADHHVVFPSSFQLIAAMNPCKCGYLNDERACRKAPLCANDYQKRISGPLLDRFDINIEVAQNNAFGEFDSSKNESSKDIAARVKSVRDLQKERYEGYNIRYNSELDGQLIVEFAFPYDEEGKKLLNDAAAKFKMSMRSYNKVLKVARTIADMEGAKAINKTHIAESLSYRKYYYHAA